MIRPEQLAGALERLDPRDRELLLLSLRRRVPDESLSRLYACTPADVARRRTGAIERLADDLGVQRGEDFGSVLQGLLDVETWTAVAEAGKTSGGAGSEFASDAPRPGGPPEEEPRVYKMPAPAELAALPESVPAPPASSSDVSPASASGASPSGLSSAPGDGVSRPGASAAPAPDASPSGASLAPGDGVSRPGASAAPAPDASPDAGSPASAEAAPAERRRPSAMLVAALGLAAFAALAGFVGARELGGGSGGTQGAGGDGVRHFVPQERGPLGAAPFPSEPADTSCYPTASISRPTVLHAEPGGDKLIRIAARTEWRSPRVLGVSSQREGWLAVTVPELPNGKVGWMRRSEARVDCVRWSLHADLSKQKLYVRKDGHTVRKMTVAVGSARHPTPEGRFAVTDKLKVSDPNSPYGCCVLALSGHQTKLPDDWPGGDRLAVHATTDVDSIGEPVSLGCMRTTSDRARWLIETIPLGAPIFIRA